MAQSSFAHSAQPESPEASWGAATAPRSRRAAPALRALSLAARVLLTLGGAILLVVGGLLPWTRGLDGVTLGARAFYQSAFAWNANFAATVGFVVILVGFLALAGLGLRSGWLTRIAGGMGIACFMLFLIQLYRAPVHTLPGLGAWMCLIGGTFALLGGAFGKGIVETPSALGASAAQA